jgi:hypothetical protein
VPIRLGSMSYEELIRFGRAPAERCQRKRISAMHHAKSSLRSYARLALSGGAGLRLLATHSALAHVAVDLDEQLLNRIG